MEEYRKICERVLNEGVKKMDRTGVGTLSVFGHQATYDLRKGFPLLTLKNTHWKSVVHELLWFISGDTNINYLIDNGVRIWNEWSDAYKNGYNGFVGNEAVREAHKDGRTDLLTLGSVYGKQWRNFGGVDQVKDVLDEAIKNPLSRRLIVSAWNPIDLPEMALPPCHYTWMINLSPIDYLDGNNNNNNDHYWIDLQLLARSQDVFLGVPFNIASYSLLLMMISNHINMYANFKTTPRNFIHSMGDTHLYLNHLDQTREMLSREELELPSIELVQKDIFEMTFDDIKLLNYDPHPTIKASVAV